MVKVRFFGSLRAVVGRDSLDLDVTRLDELLKVLREKYSELAKLIDSEGFLILVNERPITKREFNMVLDREDRVDILPIVSGGVQP
ncbi:MAG: MoaD/ThiS family protein [Sulfolobales archaeon]